jgi:uncharacterized membrane protein
MTIGRQFLPRQRWVMPVAALQLVIFLIAICLSDSYLVVSLNGLPELVLMLGFSFAGLRSGKGSLAMIVGFLMLILASVIQAIGFDALSPIGHNSLYHLISIIGVVLFYFSGRRLNASI